MSNAKSMPLLGRLAVHLKMITMDQLVEVTRLQSQQGGEPRLGQLLVDQGYIDQAQLAKLAAAQQQVIAKHRAKQNKGLVDAPPKPRNEDAAPLRAVEPAPETPAAESAPEAATPAAPTPGAAPQAEPTAPPVAEAPPAKPATPSKKPVTPTRAQAEPDEDSAIGRVEDFAEPSASDREAFLDVLRDAVGRGASDVHLHPGSPVQIRVGGCLQPAGSSALDTQVAERMLLSALDDSQRRMLAARGELDVCHTFEGIGRFRANFYREQRGLDGVLRYISAEPPTLEQLGLPARLAKFTTYHQGMVVVTGPSGCGKSSTMAALVNLINEERREHILTIEDPIEYVHPSKRCLVNQRSVNLHTESFARALRGALREDPDVIAIGELRDLETISLALSAAETGHFVIATLHTDNSIRTINRLVGSFPADQQDQVRTMLSESLRAVISQRLLPKADGSGRVPALETLVVNRAVSNLIRENKTFQIHSILQTGGSQGMALLDNAIRELVQSGDVTAEEAARHLEDGKALAA
ncbi:MAG: PilT/PilU family type 4a pilus ATPase [Myxococcota bacterium]